MSSVNLVAVASAPDAGTYFPLASSAPIRLGVSAPSARVFPDSTKRDERTESRLLRCPCEGTLIESMMPNSPDVSDISAPSRRRLALSTFFSLFVSQDLTLETSLLRMKMKREVKGLVG